jgi:hypothetical protein
MMLVDGTDIKLASEAAGDIMYNDGSKWIRLAKGNDNEVLTMNGNVPNWETASGGGGSTETVKSSTVNTTLTSAYTDINNLTFTLTAGKKYYTEYVILTKSDNASETGKASFRYYYSGTGTTTGFMKMGNEIIFGSTINSTGTHDMNDYSVDTYCLTNKSYYIRYSFSGVITATTSGTFKLQVKLDPDDSIAAHIHSASYAILREVN